MREQTRRDCLENCAGEAPQKNLIQIIFQTMAVRPRFNAAIHRLELLFDRLDGHAESSNLCPLLGVIKETLVLSRFSQFLFRAGFQCVPIFSHMHRVPLLKGATPDTAGEIFCGS